MKDVATEFQVDHFIDVNVIIGNDSIIQVETQSPKVTDLKPYLVNKNVTANNKSVNKDMTMSL